MRKVLVFNLVTLDGFFEGPNHDISWHNVDAEFNDLAEQQLADLGMLVFGRVTYELMASYWPTPTAIENDPHVANAMNALPKVVFSRTLKTADWQNTRLVSTDAAVEVANLKGSGANLVQAVVRQDADESRKRFQAVQMAIVASVSRSGSRCAMRRRPYQRRSSSWMICSTSSADRASRSRARMPAVSGTNLSVLSCW